MIRLVLLLTMSLTLRAADPQKLTAELRRIEAECGGVLGVAAMHVESGRSVGYRGKERFPMMSVAKLPAAARALGMMQAGLLPYRKMVKLEPADYSPGHSPIRDNYPDGAVLTVGQLLEASVRESDNTAHDFLLKLVEGPQMVQQMTDRVLKDGIRMNRTEKQMSLDFAAKGAEAFDADGRDSATPEAMASFLVLLARGQVLQKQATELLKEWMTQTPTGQKRIKLLLPPGTVVWHKTGTGGDRDGVNLCTNDVGAAVLPEGRGTVAMAIFVKLSKKGLEARERAIAEAALAVCDYLSEPGSK
jgi:beta-lactamase class A